MTAVGGPVGGHGRHRSQVTVTLEDLDRLAGDGRAEWDALFAAQGGVANPFCSVEWVESWYRHFTRPEDRHLLAVRSGDQLIGVAPFYLHRGRLGPAASPVRLRLVGAGQGGSLLELPQVLADPLHTRVVLRAVVEATMQLAPEGRSVDWTEISISTGQGWFEPEWTYSTGQPVAFYRPQLARASIVLALSEGWEATRTGLKRNLKESLRRSRNRLAKDGRPWKVVHRTDDLDDAAVETLLTLHHRRSQVAASVVHEDAYADPAYRAFLRDVLPKLGRQGRATLLELHLDGKAVAVQLALFAPGVTYLHSSGMEPDAWALGPVTFLQEHLVRDAADRGDQWVNFSPGPNVAKLRWSERVDVHQDFAYGCGGRALRWKYTGFVGGQALGEVGHAVLMAGSHAAPARVEQDGPTQTGPTQDGPTQTGPTQTGPTA